MILIEEASLMGELLQSGSEILRVEKLAYIPIHNAKVDSTPSLQDKPFIDMIENIQKNKSFYFSFRLDLTKRLQVVL